MPDPKDLTAEQKIALGDKDRQLNTLIGLSEKFADRHAFGKSSAVPRCFAPLDARHFKKMFRQSRWRTGPGFCDATAFVAS
jgi:hypothetical protein